MFKKFFQGALGVFTAYFIFYTVIPAAIVLLFIFLGYFLLG